MSNPPTFLYFAYGSNMLTSRLRARTPSARVVTVATLAHHELRWHKVSRDGSGKCDIVPDPTRTHSVLGVVFEIPIIEKPELDRAEGLGMGYDERQMEVHAACGPLLPSTYQATHIDRLALPYSWYKALVIAGAREHRFPDLYIRALETARTKGDQDRDREAANLLLANGG